MTIEILAIGTLIIIICLVLAVYRDYRRDKQAEEIAEFEVSVKKLQEVWRPVKPERPSYVTYLALGWAKAHLINTDELGRQAQDYERYADTRPIPEFIETALERRADIELSGEIPSAFLDWANDASEGE